MLYVSLVWSLHQPQVPWLTAWKAKPQTIRLSREVGTCRLRIVGRQTFCVHLLNKYHTWTRSKFKKGKKGACKWTVVMWWYMNQCQRILRTESQALRNPIELNITIGRSVSWQPPTQGSRGHRVCISWWIISLMTARDAMANLWYYCI